MSGKSMTPQHRGLWETLIAVIVVTTVAVMSLSIILNVLEAPLSRWNNIRLTPTFALLAGFPLYSTPNEGPIYSWIYGPLAAIVYLPATLASSPVIAIIVAALESVVFFLLPLLGIFFICSQHPIRSQQILMTLLGLVSFYALISTHQGLVYSMFEVHVDAPAIGFATLSALFLKLRERNWMLHCSIAAMFAVFSVLTKQTMLPVLFAIPLYVLVVDGLQKFWRVSLMLGGLFIVCGAIVLSIFGIEPVVFTMLDYPRMMGWHSHLLLSAGLDNGWTFAIPLLKFSEDLRDGFLLILLLPIFIIGWHISLSKSSDTFRVSLNSTAMLLLLFAVLLLPVSILARAKIGGAMNSYAPTTYFLIAASVAGTLEIIHSHKRIARRASLVGIGLLILCASTIIPTSVPTVIQQINADPLKSAWDSAPQQAYHFLLQYPESTYFPWYPLSTLMAEEKVYHTGVGLVDRELAGVPTSEKHLQQYLPKDLRFIAMRTKGRREKVMLNLHFDRFNIAGDAYEVGACSNTEVYCLDSSWKLYSVFPRQPYKDYVDKYPDLVAEYKKNSAEVPKYSWGLQHFCKFGLLEGRSYPGVSAIHCGIL